MPSAPDGSIGASSQLHEMLFEKDVPVPMRDGAVLDANVFRPMSDGAFPVLMTFGPYGKDVHIREYMPAAWDALQLRHPEILRASSCRYLGFETPDPEAWVLHGYVVIKVDSRGAGKSPGRLDVNSPAEFEDFHDAIEWAGTQSWCSGKVGLLGVSYYAAGQWMVASLRPPHLAAILPWQGSSDFYRDRTRQGGIFANGFTNRWYANGPERNQHGNPSCDFTDFVTGERNTGPAAVSADELRAARSDYIQDIVSRPLDGPWYRSRSPQFDKIDLPALVVANWGGLGLHSRGTIQGYLNIASRDKWLKVQCGSYFATFFQPEHVALQRRFFDRYLKGIDNGWEDEPKVDIAVRGPGDTVKRFVRAREWPLEGTHWTRLYLDAETRGLNQNVPRRPAQASYSALSDGVSFETPPLERGLEFAGPIKARIWVSSGKEDMDLFVTLRAFDHQSKELTFLSATEPRSPLSQGWLRVAHRKTDPERSTEYWPYHTHDEPQKLVPDEIYAVDIEIWPASISLPAGYRLALTIQGRDFQRPGAAGTQRGSGFFLHDDEIDRPPYKYDGRHTVHTGPTHASHLLLPVIS